MTCYTTIVQENTRGAGIQLLLLLLLWLDCGSCCSSSMLSLPLQSPFRQSWPMHVMIMRCRSTVNMLLALPLVLLPCLAVLLLLLLLLPHEVPPQPVLLELEVYIFQRYPLCLRQEQQRCQLQTQPAG
jgi:hypothetical protein